MIEYRPYEIIDIPGMGYSLIATVQIEIGYIICEYLGELKIYNETDDEDEENEQFELEKDIDGNLWTICSSIYANEARFIAGTPYNKSRYANCVAKKLLVNGTPWLFIVSSKRINKGDILYIDYGSGYETKESIFKV